MPMDVRRFTPRSPPEFAVKKRRGPMSDGLRMLVFLELVQFQDEGMGVAKSRAVSTNKYGLTLEQMIEIETEGRTKNWAPL